MKKNISFFRSITKNARYKRYPKPINSAGIVQPNGQVITSTFPSFKDINEYVWHRANAFSLSLLIIGFASLFGSFVYRMYLLITSNYQLLASGTVTFSQLLDLILQIEFPNPKIILCALSGGIVSSLVFFRVPINKQDRYIARLASGITILCIINTVYFRMIQISVTGTPEFYLPPELLTAQISAFWITSFFTAIYRKHSHRSILKIHLYPSVREIMDLIRHILFSMIILLFVNWFTYQLYPHFLNSSFSFFAIYGALKEHLIELSLFFTGATFTFLFYYRVKRQDIVTTPNLVIRLLFIVICILTTVYTTRQFSTDATYWTAQIINVILVIIFIPIQRQLTLFFIGNDD